MTARKLVSRVRERLIKLPISLSTSLKREHFLSSPPTTLLKLRILPKLSQPLKSQLHGFGRAIINQYTYVVLLNNARHITHTGVRNDWQPTTQNFAHTGRRAPKLAQSLAKKHC